MNQIREHIERAEKAMEAVRGHCMAATVSLDKNYLLVLYPPGFSMSGVRVSRANGVAWAAERALEKMEREWVSSYPAGRAPR